MTLRSGKAGHGRLARREGELAEPLQERDERGVVDVLFWHDRDAVAGEQYSQFGYVRRGHIIEPKVGDLDTERAQDVVVHGFPSHGTKRTLRRMWTVFC